MSDKKKILKKDSYNTKTDKIKSSKTKNTKLNLPTIEYDIKQKINYPLQSTSGRRCLTKCHPKGNYYLHPVLLTGVRDRAYDTCAIDPAHSKDPQYYRENDMILADKCRMEDNMTYNIPNELDSILLSFYFNARDFLAGIYNLHSFDQVIYWTMENDYLPFDTIKRIHNCAWKVFGNKMEELTSGVLEYYYNLAKEYWLYDYSKAIQKDHSFQFVVSKDPSVISSSTSEIYDVLLTKFFDYSFFVSNLKRYIYEYEGTWELYVSHYDRIKIYIYEKLVHLIENSIKTD